MSNNKLSFSKDFDRLLQELLSSAVDTIPKAETKPTSKVKIKVKEKNKNPRK